MLRSVNAFSQANEMRSSCRNQKGQNSRIVFFLGIGGSALGPISVLEALSRSYVGAEISFSRKSRCVLNWLGTIKNLRPESTLVCVVTKSGTTFETMAHALLYWRWIGSVETVCKHSCRCDHRSSKRRSSKLFARKNISDPNTLYSSVDRWTIQYFFSCRAFSDRPCWLPNVSEFLTGAKQVRDYLEKGNFEKNPLFILGADLIRKYSKRSDSRLHALLHAAEIHRRLVRSTLGRKFRQRRKRGFTPLAALGATDQHEHFTTSPRRTRFDKITFFITVDKVENEVKIPRAPVVQMGKSSLPAFKILEGHSLHELLTTEYQATSMVLIFKKSRPNFEYSARPDPRTELGALYFSFSVLTAFTGTLWGVNPFDQPGVEEAKVYIREALSKPPEYSPEEDENSPVNRLRRGSS